MAQRNINVVPSSPLAKAFQTNVQRDVYADIFLTQTKPSGQGVVLAGDGGEYSATRILLFPYAECEPGQAFFMRLYGWRSAGDKQYRPVWVYYILAEFLCVTGNIRGPVNMPNAAPGPSGFNLPISPTENMSQSLALMQGVLGSTGFINSMPPGTNCTAFAGVEIQGSQLLSFDFAQLPDGGVPSCSMNCWWAMA